MVALKMGGCVHVRCDAGEVMEHAVLLSVKLKDQSMFERHFNQLKTFYTDTRCASEHGSSSVVDLPSPSLHRGICALDMLVSSPRFSHGRLHTN